MTDLDELVSAARSLDAEPPAEVGANVWAGLAGPGGPAATAAAGTSLLTKIGIGVVLVGTIGVGVAVGTSTKEPTPSAPTGPAPSVVVAEQEIEEDVEVEADEPQIEIEEDAAIEPAPDLDDSPPAVAKPKSERRVTPSKDPAAPSLHEETVLIKAARVALVQGHPRTALSKLRTHQRRFPNGDLTELRRALTVEVLCKLDRVDEARKAADDFVKRHPTSSLTGRVRNACAKD